MEKKRPLLCVVDASSFIFRAYYAIRQLSTKKGLPTNATFGFANMIAKVLEDLKPTHLAIVYDTKHPSFRKEMYPDYKANRSAMPEDLVPQIPYIKKFVDAMGLPCFEQAGLEADDIIAALAHFARKNAEDVCIVSSDKDLMQLVNHHTWMFDTMKNLRIGPEQVKEKMGVSPELITDYLGLVGDSSDNIPGVKGIGPKSAASLLEQFGSIEGIYKNIDVLKPSKQKESLIANKENAFLSKNLATVRWDIGVKYEWEKLECKPVFNEAITELLTELEFHNLGVRLQKLAGGNSANSEAPKVVFAKAPATESEAEPEAVPGTDSRSLSIAGGISSSGEDKVKACNPKYECVQDLATLEKVFAKLGKIKELALDTETTGLALSNSEVVGFSICAGDEEAWYIPVGHTPTLEASSKQCDRDEAMALLNKFLQNKKIVGQNIKFDMNMLRKYGVEIHGDSIAFDSMLASYVLDPNARHNMDALALKYLGHENISYESLCGKGKAEITFADVPIDKATEYAAEDAHVTWLLYKNLKPLIDAMPSLKKVYYEIDLPLIGILADMEWEGIAIDKKLLKKLSKQFSEEMDILQKKAHDLAGGEFNLASPKQLQEILFEKLKLPTFRKTKSGYSTDVEVLSKLAMMHDLPRVILDYRELAKLKSTYIDVLPVLADAKDRVHTSYHITVAATGRLSSSDPNLQNIPIRTELGKKIRESFVAKEGCVLLGADYSQIELRILAHLSGDEALCEAFQNQQDIHTMTASKVFGVATEAVTPDLRRKAKAINFGLIYGKTAFSLAEELGISRKEAMEIIENYFNQYPSIKKFLEGLAESAQKLGYAETLYGRRRAIPEIHSKNKMLKNMAERMAINTPMQGTAADLIKIAMNVLAEEMKKEKFQARMILQVHDELVLEVPEREVKAVASLVRKCMEGVGELKGFPRIKVPLAVDVGTGPNWLEIK